MKLGRILADAVDGPMARLVAVQPAQGTVIDLAAAERLRLLRRGASDDAARRYALVAFPGSMAAALALGEEFLERAQAAIDAADDTVTSGLSARRWLPAVDPPVMRDCLAFEQHLKNAYGSIGLPIPPLYYEIPAYYKASSTGLIGHEAVVPWPAYTQSMDYELELGFVIGRAGRNLKPSEAKRHIFGVTIYNDFSARDIQQREMTLQLGPAKSKDFATALGPWITTLDELDLGALEMSARVNGAEWSRGSSGSITWSPAELIAYISYGETILPGDLIGSGTVGSGCGLELGRRLQPGDVVELEVAGIGVLRNTLGQPEEAGWNPVPRRRAGDASD